jgi:thiamine-phosphate pyrophosphorylase
VTICFVTGRRRLQRSIEGLLALVEDAVRAGVDLIQVRERDLEANVLAVLVSDVMAVARGSDTKVVVNDRLDVALACGADGVHLRADSVGVAAARRIAPRGFLVGRSVHTVDEARVASSERADYLMAGTLYPTSSKPDASGWLGNAGLRTIVRASSVPVLAIGGVTLDQFADVAATGAAGVAAISLFGQMPAAQIVAAARLSFDSAKPAP